MREKFRYAIAKTYKNKSRLKVTVLFDEIFYDKHERKLSVSKMRELAQDRAIDSDEFDNITEEI